MPRQNLRNNDGDGDAWPEKIKGWCARAVKEPTSTIPVGKGDEETETSGLTDGQGHGTTSNFIESGRPVAPRLGVLGGNYNYDARTKVSTVLANRLRDATSVPL